MRGCRKINDPSTRTEMIRFARDDFERNRDVTDIVSLLRSRDHMKVYVEKGITDCR